MTQGKQLLKKMNCAIDSSECKATSRGVGAKCENNS